LREGYSLETRRGEDGAEINELRNEAGEVIPLDEGALRVVRLIEEKAKIKMDSETNPVVRNDRSEKDFARSSAAADNVTRETIEGFGELIIERDQYGEIGYVKAAAPIKDAKILKNLEATAERYGGVYDKQNGEFAFGTIEGARRFIEEGCL
jgi:hypothetical protein